ncbi:MAG: HEPN domain-containing protein [Paludibacteraceae bacterium]|nr:HEPN domain-containing protein [Paludibacteraceae bacterium]
MKVNIDTKQILNYWIESAEKDFKTMNDLYETKNYIWSLFIGHLVIEKLLKAHYVKKQQKHPLFIHDLLRLARISQIELTEEQEEWLDEITAFNLNTRYDNYKQEFRTRCTKEYTAQ